MVLLLLIWLLLLLLLFCFVFSYCCFCCWSCSSPSPWCKESKPDGWSHAQVVITIFVKVAVVVDVATVVVFVDVVAVVHRPLVVEGAEPDGWAGVEVLHPAVGGIPVQLKGPQRHLLIPQQVSDWLIDWFIDWLIDWLVDCLMDWSVSCFVGWMFHSCVEV